MEIEREVKKMTLGHDFGAGAACLKCKEKCEGFELHFWRKICRNCKCGLADHNVHMESEESKKVGRLFEDTKYTGLIAKLKTDGVPTYRGSAVTISLAGPASSYLVPPPASGASVVPPTAAPFGGGTGATGAGATAVSVVPVTVNASSAATETLGKDTPMQCVTYEWAPPGANKYMAVRYIELLPPEKRPVVGSEGAVYRRQQMACQLPEHDQDPSKCHELSPAEVKTMQQFVRKYKDEALGMGDVCLPEEMALVRAAGEQGGPGATGGVTAAAAGAMGPGGGTAGPQQSFSCSHCEQPMRRGEPAVYAERAGYDRLWHPACFVCCTCSELLVDMIYFWKKGKLYCGRHYGDSEKPRCGGCDELIFSNEYTQAENQNWHLKHFCCFDCDCVLAGETYVMEKDKPVCTPCYMINYAVRCVACQQPVEPEAQRVSYGDSHWHAEPECFRCSGCSKCLVGERFMAGQDKLFCSVDCKKKTTA
ncbi:hypothetical protein NHX12_002301 [Muraenolepis orangiensis]|uniref:Testin n=1 Tax=Muraenolepis orangiensis TaxID=630683 RepID=A0A9Q0DWS9_9TELE|nr:hypothetical protein NHX12_002301 [Muraenolepis orangiensis]